MKLENEKLKKDVNPLKLPLKFERCQSIKVTTQIWVETHDFHS